MKTNLLLRIGRFYLDGFKEMTLGRTLWTIILIKLFIMFFILRLFFFPDFLSVHKSETQKQEYVAGELINRKTPNQ